LSLRPADQRINGGCPAGSIDSKASHGIHGPAQGVPEMNAKALATAVESFPPTSAEDAAMVSRAQHDRMANAIRALAMDAVEQANCAPPALPVGAPATAPVLFTRSLKFAPADPAWPDRDRFVLSAGHGSMLVYALLHLVGYEKMTIDEI